MPTRRAILKPETEIHFFSRYPSDSAGGLDQYTLFAPAFCTKRPQIHAQQQPLLKPVEFRVRNRLPSITPAPGRDNFSNRPFLQGAVSEFHKVFRLYESQDENAWRRLPVPVIATQVRLQSNQWHFYCFWHHSRPIYLEKSSIWCPTERPLKKLDCG